MLHHCRHVNGQNKKLSLVPFIGKGQNMDPTSKRGTKVHGPFFLLKSVPKHVNELFNPSKDDCS